MNSNTYQLIRNSLELESTTIKKMQIINNINNIPESLSGDIIQDFSITDPTVEITDSFIAKATLQLKVTLSATDNLDRNHKETFLSVFFAFEGSFCGDKRTYMNSTVRNFRSEVEKLAIPLLLPYLKSNLQITSSLLNIPPFKVPTIDILKTIDKNSKSK